MQFVETPLDINSMPLQSPFAVSGRLVQHPPSQLPIPHLKKKKLPIPDLRSSRIAPWLRRPSRSTPARYRCTRFSIARSHISPPPCAARLALDVVQILVPLPPPERGWFTTPAASWLDAPTLGSRVVHFH
jgi:hypothetical protein